MPDGEDNEYDRNTDSPCMKIKEEHRKWKEECKSNKTKSYKGMYDNAFAFTHTLGVGGIGKYLAAGMQYFFAGEEEFE